MAKPEEIDDPHAALRWLCSHGFQFVMGENGRLRCVRADGKKATKEERSLIERHRDSFALLCRWDGGVAVDLCSKAIEHLLSRLSKERAHALLGDYENEIDAACQVAQMGELRRLLTQMCAQANREAHSRG